MPTLSTIRLQSSALHRVMTYSVLTPELREAGSGPFPVLYLLHPYGGDHADWILHTRLEQHISALPLIVVLPSLNNSLGLDTAVGENYERFFVDELMAHVESACPVLHGPEQTAIAGAGTGGYAALRYALAYPYWFGAAAALSADIHAAREDRTLELPGGKERVQRYRAVFGEADHPRRKHYDLYSLAERLPDGQSPPALMIDCGTDDPRITPNRDFHRRLTQLRIRHDYAEPRGGHDWNYWDQRLPPTLAFFSKYLGLK